MDLKIFLKKFILRVFEIETGKNNIVDLPVGFFPSSIIIEF